MSKNTEKVNEFKKRANAFKNELQDIMIKYNVSMGLHNERLIVEDNSTGYGILFGERVISIYKSDLK